MTIQDYYDGMLQQEPKETWLKCLKEWHQRGYISKDDAQNLATKYGLGQHDWPQAIHAHYMSDDD